MALPGVLGPAGCGMVCARPDIQGDAQGGVSLYVGPQCRGRESCPAPTSLRGLSRPRQEAVTAWTELGAAGRWRQGEGVAHRQLFSQALHPGSLQLGGTPAWGGLPWGS